MLSLRVEQNVVKNEENMLTRKMIVTSKNITSVTDSELNDNNNLPAVNLYQFSQYRLRDALPSVWNYLLGQTCNNNNNSNSCDKPVVPGEAL